MSWLNYGIKALNNFLIMSEQKSINFIQFIFYCTLCLSYPSVLSGATYMNIGLNIHLNKYFCICLNGEIRNNISVFHLNIASRASLC